MFLIPKISYLYDNSLNFEWSRRDNEQGLEKKKKRERKEFKITLGCVCWGDAHVNEAKTETQAGIKMSCESQEIQVFWYEAQRRQFFLLQTFSSLSITRLSKMCECKVRCMHVCVSRWAENHFLAQKRCFQ